MIDAADLALMCGELLFHSRQLRVGAPAAVEVDALLKAGDDSLYRPALM